MELHGFPDNINFISMSLLLALFDLLEYNRSPFIAPI